jgi:hypothetical protein
MIMGISAMTESMHRKDDETAVPGDRFRNQHKTA